MKRRITRICLFLSLTLSLFLFLHWNFLPRCRQISNVYLFHFLSSENILVTENKANVYHKFFFRVFNISQNSFTRHEIPFDSHEITKRGSQGFRLSIPSIQIRMQSRILSSRRSRQKSRPINRSFAFSENVKTSEYFRKLY